VKVYEAIVKGENIPEPGIPESFKVLVKEMQSLCLNVEVLSSDGVAMDMRGQRRGRLPSRRRTRHRLGPPSQRRCLERRGSVSRRARRLIPPR
jgi:hypothetical protein